MVGSERHVCNAAERIRYTIIAVQGQFRVLQGRWFWYQSKARIWYPISDQWQPWSYLAPFRRSGGLLVEKSPKSPVRTHPSLRNRPSLGWPLSNFVMSQIFLETRMFRLSYGEEIMTLAFFVLIQYRTDGRTDRRTDRRTFLLWLYQRLHSSLC